MREDARVTQPTTWDGERGRWVSATTTEPLAFIVSLNEERGGVQLPILGPSFSIGRDGTNNLCVADDQAVSRHHCVIHVMGASLMIEDCSRNGTYLDGKRVAGIAPLPVPASVLVGHTRLAVVPNRADDGDVTSIIETSFSTEDSVIIPGTSFLRMRTDAYLVVDVVNSTRLVQADGPYFAKLMLAMGRALERSLKTESEPFLKCTGDGYFACFGSAGSALDAGMRLAPTLAKQMPVNAQLSIALHWGPSHLTEQGDRIGNNVHAVFSLEQLRHDDAALEEEMASQSTADLVLMTEPFWAELADSDRALARPLGLFRLKGMDEGMRVYRWMPPARERANELRQTPGSHAD